MTNQMTNEMTDQERAIQNLEAMIAWIRQHPAAPVPYALRVNHFTCRLSDDKATRDREVRAIGTSRKEFTDNELRLVADVNRSAGKYGIALGFEIEWYCPRKNVCTATVVGTREVPEEIIPEHRIPAHTEDVIEWNCEPLLAADAASEPEEAL